MPLWDLIVTPYWHLHDSRYVGRDPDGDAVRRRMRTEDFDRAFEEASTDPALRADLIKTLEHRRRSWFEFSSRFRHCDDFHGVIQGFVLAGVGVSHTLFLWWPIMWCWYRLRWHTGRGVMKKLDRALNQECCPDCGYTISAPASPRTPEAQWAALRASRLCPECAGPWPGLPPQVPAAQQ